MTKKLLFIVNVDWFFVSHRLPIAIEAIKKGYEIHLACAMTSKEDELKSHGIIIHPLALSRSGTGIKGELSVLYQIFSMIKKVNPNIIHTVTIKPVLYGNFIARLLRVPVRISSISGLGYVFIAKGFKSKVFRQLISFMYRVALSGANSVIFQNESDRNLLKKMGAITLEQEVFIRGSGVALDSYPVIVEPTGSPVVMLVARLLIDKGVNEFVDAAKRIKIIQPDIRMVLVGDIDAGNPKSISTQELKAWVENKVIEHWGYSHNVAVTMAKANIIVLPSYREGLPKSLIEAAACGRAVVTTDVPGCRDAIEVNKTGLLVPVKSDKQLASAILKLVNDKPMRQKFSSRAREFAQETFDINDVINIHMSIYNQ